MKQYSLFLKQCSLLATLPFYEENCNPDFGKIKKTQSPYTSSTPSVQADYSLSDDVCVLIDTTVLKLSYYVWSFVITTIAQS